MPEAAVEPKGLDKVLLCSASDVEPCVARRHWRARSTSWH